MSKKSVGSGYISTTKTGEKMLRLTIEGAKYVVFANNYKKKEKHPDMLVYKAVSKNQRVYGNPAEELSEPKKETKAERNAKVKLPF